MQNWLTIFAGGRDIAADLAEDFRAHIAAEPARHFLLDFNHPNVAFRQIIIKRHLKIPHKCQHFFGMVSQAVEQVFGEALFDPTALPLGSLRGVDWLTDLLRRSGHNHP